MPPEMEGLEGEIVQPNPVSETPPVMQEPPEPLGTPPSIDEVSPPEPPVTDDDLDRYGDEDEDDDYDDRYHDEV